MEPPVKILKLPGYVTLDEAAEMMNVDKRYVERLFRAGYLPEPARVHRATGMMMFKESDIRAYIADHPRLGQNRKLVTA